MSCPFPTLAELGNGREGSGVPSTFCGSQSPFAPQTHRIEKEDFLKQHQQLSQGARARKLGALQGLPVVAPANESLSSALKRASKARAGHIIRVFLLRKANALPHRLSSSVCALTKQSKWTAGAVQRSMGHERCASKAPRWPM